MSSVDIVVKSHASLSKLVLSHEAIDDEATHDVYLAFSNTVIDLTIALAYY